MAYQPPISFTTLNSNNQNKPKRIEEDLLGLGYTSSSSNSNIIKQNKNSNLQNRKKVSGGGSGALFNPDDILTSFASGNRRTNDFDDDIAYTSLLSSQNEDFKPISSKSTINMSAYPGGINPIQAKQAMQEKMKKQASMSNERPKNLVQKFIFDPFKYQAYFDTTTDEIQNRMLDALWPFIPENQHHLIENDAEQVREFQKKPNQSKELYGPIWIMVTLIIELCILGHLQTVLSSQSNYSSSLTAEDILVKQANYSIQKVFKTTFFILLMFVVNPFVSYLIFKNRGAIEVTYASLFQIYGYSFAIFIPLALVNCIFMPLNRLRIFLLLVCGAISLYYLYKETKEYLTKYIVDDQTWKYFVGYITGSTAFFMLLFRYYFLQA